MNTSPKKRKRHTASFLPFLLALLLLLLLSLDGLFQQLLIILKLDSLGFCQRRVPVLFLHDLLRLVAVSLLQLLKLCLPRLNLQTQANKPEN